MPLAPPPPLGARPLPADTFKDQIVYITGGGTGLGKAIALEFARCGADIAIASRDPAHRAAGVAAIEALGRRATGVAVDVRQPEQVARSFDEVEAALGPVSILINNAAGNFPVPAERMSANARVRAPPHRARRGRGDPQHRRALRQHRRAGGQPLGGGQGWRRQPHQIAGGGVGAG
jgi:NAD(P)-dependent dehydrogenase (short-subunit alcohol dehydrogenase family)